MTFARTDDQRALEQGLTVHLSRVGNQHSNLWQAAVADFGLDGLGTSEDAGGLGTGAREAAIVARALGEAGFELPWAEHWVAVRLEDDRRSDQRPDNPLPRVACLIEHDDRRSWAEDAQTILHCAEIAGLCDALLRDTVAFAKERRQFGVAIASFQVLRHRMVDMRLAHEQAAAITGYAVDLMDGRLDRDDPARHKAVSAARVLAEDAVRIVGGGAVQIHGAMGLTEELRIGRLFRRASELAQGDGTGRAHLRRYASAG